MEITGIRHRISAQGAFAPFAQASLTWFVVMFLAITSGPGSCLAGRVQIEGADPTKILKIEISEHSVEAVIDDLAKRFDFHFIKASPSASGATITATMEGPLIDIIGRLLRNRNYLLTYSGSQGRVTKVKLIDDRSGTSPSSVPLLAHPRWEDQKQERLEVQIPGRIPVPINPVPPRQQK